MANNGHALLSASAAHRWLNCPPSARLGEFIEDKESEFAKEGTDAHELCEIKLKEALGTKGQIKMPTLVYYDQEMEDSAKGYVSFVLELLKEIKERCKDPIVLIEQKIDYSKYVKDGFGTVDLMIVADDTLHIIDFKYGKGVSVDAYENPQMKLYSIGGLEIFDGIYDIKKVSMTIYQPRLSNISTFEIAKDDLYNWAENTLKPIAKQAYKGEGEFKCGEWCRWCKCKDTCRKRAEEKMALASLEFKEPPLLEDEEIIEILNKVDGLVEWANDVKDYALKCALNGKKWTGYKLVEGRANRKYTNDSDVIKAVTEAGHDPFEKKLLSITEMQKRLGKALFNDLLGNLIIKPAGKPTLVLESDKRPEINTAKQDFMTTEEN